MSITQLYTCEIPFTTQLIPSSPYGVTGVPNLIHSTANDTCAAHVEWFVETTLTGEVLQQSAASSAEACCTMATKLPSAQYWQFSKGLLDHGVCELLGSVTGGSKKLGYTAGQADGPLIWSRITDLADFSCLNGWTMG